MKKQYKARGAMSWALMILMALAVTSGDESHAMYQGSKKEKTLKFSSELSTVAHKETSKKKKKPAKGKEHLWEEEITIPEYSKEKGEENLVSGVNMFLDCQRENSSSFFSTLFSDISPHIERLKEGTRLFCVSEPTVESILFSLYNIMQMRNINEGGDVVVDADGGVDGKGAATSLQCLSQAIADLNTATRLIDGEGNEAISLGYVNPRDTDEEMKSILPSLSDVLTAHWKAHLRNALALIERDLGKSEGMMCLEKPFSDLVRTVQSAEDLGFYDIIPISNMTYMFAFLMHKESLQKLPKALLWAKHSLDGSKDSLALAENMDSLITAIEEIEEDAKEKKAQ